MFIHLLKNLIKYIIFLEIKLKGIFCKITSYLNCSQNFRTKMKNNY